MARAMLNGADHNLLIIISGAVVSLMLLLILLLIFIACKPWRFFSRSSFPSRTRTIKGDDLQRPLVTEDLNLIQNQIEVARDYYINEGACHQNQGGFNSPWSHALSYEQKLASSSPQMTDSDSFVLDVSDLAKEDVVIGQTIKSPLLTNRYAEEHKSGIKEDINYDLRFGVDSGTFGEFILKHTTDQRSTGSTLKLEVISGPSHGLCCSIKSANTSKLPLTLGRASPSDILLNDSEVSGKHAMINWNLHKKKWELVDMGSLNGTLVNSQAVNNPCSGQRKWGDPTELDNGDVITLGATSKIIVQIKSQTDCYIPFGLGVASDPMALRRGARKLPMEDVCYYQWPLPGVDQFGLFGICDGHGGADAATSVSKIMPDMIASILSDSFKRELVLSQRDASDVLIEAFFQTEACINHYYEGCTATVLLVWADSHENFFVQCANVGDSACIVNIDGKQIKMTEDHRVTSHSERVRMQAIGEPLKDGETRLCGINLARMLGDKFLKQQDGRFSSEPYISQVVCIHQASQAFALLASDGFWDVINFKKAVQLVCQTKERNVVDGENSAEAIANYLLSEARKQRTKDNTSIVFIDFNTSRINSCKPDPQD